MPVLGLAHPDELIVFTLDDVGSLTEAYAAEVDALPTASAQGTLEDARSFFVGVDAALRTARDELDAMSPPESAAAAHEDLVLSYTELAALTTQVAERAETLRVC